MIVYQDEQGNIYENPPQGNYKILEIDDNGFFEVVGYGSEKHDRKSNENNQLSSGSDRPSTNPQKNSNTNGTTKKDSQKGNNKPSDKPTSQREANTGRLQLDIPTKFRLPNGKAITLQKHWEFYKWQYWKYTVDNEVKYLRQDSNGNWEAVKFSGKTTLTRKIDNIDEEVIALLEIYGKVIL